MRSHFQVEHSQQQWRNIHPMIDAWLNARQSLLVEYMLLAGLNPNRARTHINPEILQKFCEQLVDYVSTGHFEVYNFIFESLEKASGDPLELAKKIYPKLRVSTDFALDFNDKYNHVNEDNLLNIDHDLNKLGPLLEHRFEIEDKLIQALDIISTLEKTLVDASSGENMTTQRHTN